MREWIVWIWRMTLHLPHALACTQNALKNALIKTPNKLKPSPNLKRSMDLPLAPPRIIYDKNAHFVIYSDQEHHKTPLGWSSKYHSSIKRELLNPQCSDNLTLTHLTHNML